jgi:hypothetical protein
MILRRSRVISAMLAWIDWFTHDGSRLKTSLFGNSDCIARAMQYANND